MPQTWRRGLITPRYIYIYNIRYTTQYRHIWILIQVCFVDQQKLIHSSVKLHTQWGIVKVNVSNMMRDIVMRLTWQLHFKEIQTTVGALMVRLTIFENILSSMPTT